MSSSNNLSVVKNNNNYLLTPSSFKEAMDYSSLIANSSFCPKGMQNKPGDVFIAIQMGAEVGLSPMQALQNIAVINGRPCVWGDAALALVQSHRRYIDHKEWTEGSIEKGDLTAYCSVTRKGSEECIRSFSIEDAKKAGLWTKQGVWQQYPKRMLQMRARAFALRDKFSDALKGLNVREEVEDYNVNEKNNFNRVKTNVVNLDKNTVTIESKPELNINLRQNDIEIESVYDQFSLDIGQSESIDRLKEVFKEISKYNFGDRKDLLDNLITKKDNKKIQLTAQISQEFFGEEEAHATAI